MVLPNTEISFVDIAWSKHPTFEGVELKHIVISEQTGGQFSYHLVKIALNKKNKTYVCETQLETHEVISGNGVCINKSAEIKYEAGIISIQYQYFYHIGIELYLFFA